MEAMPEALAAGEMTTIVAMVEAVGPDRFHMELELVPVPSRGSGQGVSGPGLRLPAFTFA
jgi:hypothetical protein